MAPLSGVHFQLWRRGEELLVPRSSSSPDRVFFHLEGAAAGDSGPYTCRYRLHAEEAAWSTDSAPTELVWSDGEPGDRQERGRLGLAARREPEGQGGPAEVRAHTTALQTGQ